jgi:hypothetical protein
VEWLKVKALGSGPSTTKKKLKIIISMLKSAPDAFIFHKRDATPKYHNLHDSNLVCKYSCTPEKRLKLQTPQCSYLRVQVLT